MASGSRYGTINIWDYSSFVLKCTLRQPTSRLKILLAKLDRELMASTNANQINVWDYSNGVLRQIIEASSHIESLISLSPSLLAGGLRDGRVQVWDTSEKSLKFSLEGHVGVVWCLCTLRDNILASGSSYPDSSIKIWSLLNQSLLYTFDSTNGGHRKDVKAMTLLKKGLLMASVSNDESIKVWRI